MRSRHCTRTHSRASRPSTHCAENSSTDSPTYTVCPHDHDLLCAVLTLRVGLLCLLTGQHILAVTGSEALACGYFLHAAKSLGAIGGFGVRQMLNDRFPGCIAIPDAEKQISIPTMMKSGTIPAPVLRRAPPSNSNDTSNSDVPIEEDTNSAENLDTIT